ncbi:restriction endonuclease subunit S [Candidatus Saccharibacteria bacterium]|nr:restriction endonuclease subunit S [Candidatus Saccharibacteria bacterium]
MKETKFKQTEVGMIPSDWEVCEIGSVCSIFGRIGFRGYTVLDLVDEGCGAITLSPSNIKNNRMDYSKYTEISWKKYEESPEIKIFNGDILLVKTGSTFGKSALVENLPHEATINPQFVVLKKIQISNAYLNYVIADTVVQKQIQETIVGGAIPTLSQKQIAGFNIPLPSSTEQQRIANALSDVDTLINNLEKLIAKKKNIKQGAMQQLLTGRKRLPGFGSDERQKECHSERSATREVEESSGYKMTELGMIPSDWEVKTVSDVADNFIGLTYSPENVRDYGTLVLRSSNIQNDKIVYEDNVFVDMVIPERALAHDGDILVCVRNGSKALIGKSAILDIGNAQMAFGAFMTVLRAKRGIDNRYLLYAWQSNMIQDQVQESLGATINQITNADFKRFYLLTPSSIEEQTAIANVLSDMDTEISALETKLAKYRTLKTGMMQQLLTGKIRLI